MKKTILITAVFAAFVSCAAGMPATTLDFAKDEASRLMGRAGVKCAVSVSRAPLSLSVALDSKGGAPAAPSVGEVKFDGYALSVGPGGYCVAARCEKGVLNGLYALAERLGFAFVMPGDDGEYVPAELEDLGEGAWTENPRFERRGLFASSANHVFTDRQWYHFLAKLRFNSLCAHVSGSKVVEDSFARLMGMRLEVGGHGMSACLPRELFEKEPELFRMFQPEDFAGKRMKDSNFCPSNPKTRRIVKENFKKRIASAIKNGYHAVHAWADDLPAGGWCMCSRCRALTATDQAQYVMNLEAQAVRETGSSLRVPAIAYHDTMFPSYTIAPDPLCFLLFAPRERCYAHALDDPSCALNRHYLKALEEWTARYRGIDDSHTFEYYNDKILYRGHTPYLPETVIGDGDVYEKAGIEAWMSLQVGGELLAPDWNMLAHAIVAWESGHTRDSMTRRLAGMLSGRDGDWESWYRYLDRRASAYRSSFSVCDIPTNLYFDYRFMPERPSANGGAKLVEQQRLGAEILVGALDSLKRDSKSMKGFGARIAGLEIKRCTFEKTDLQAMAEHQRGLNAIGDYWNGAGDEALATAIKYLESAVKTLELASKECDAHRTKDSKQYYNGFVKNWTVPEIRNKIRVYSTELKKEEAK